MSDLKDVGRTEDNFRREEDEFIMKISNNLEAFALIYNSDNSDIFKNENYIKQYGLAQFVCGCDNTKKIKESFSELDKWAFSLYNIIKDNIKWHYKKTEYNAWENLKSIEALVEKKEFRDAMIIPLLDVFGSKVDDYMQEIYEAEKFNLIREHGKYSYKCSSCDKKIPRVYYPWINIEYVQEPDDGINDFQ